MMMRRTPLRLLVSCLIAATLMSSSGVTAERRNNQQRGQVVRKPNIIFILGDDLGYCDVSMYGCSEIPTPNIDSIAESGVKFTNGYVTAPVCSPSRAGLMTGRYQHRFGFEFNAGALQRALGDPEMGLPTLRDHARAGAEAGWLRDRHGRQMASRHAREVSSDQTRLR